MSSAGDLNAGVKRPSAPGANTQLLYNQGGIEGANSNLTFDYANNSLNVTGNIVSTNNIITSNIQGVNVYAIVSNPSFYALFGGAQ